MDSAEYVEKLDEEGISLVRRILGTEVFRLEHRFGRLAQGATYRSRMVVGSSAGPTAWLTHNMEEVGLFEHILPPLYWAAMGQAPVRTGRGGGGAVGRAQVSAALSPSALEGAGR